LEEYLTVHRPVLLMRGGHAKVCNTSERAPSRAEGRTSPEFERLEGPLWINEYGATMSSSGISSTLGKATSEIFGVAINPHAFRSAAATTSAWHAPSTPNLASGVLNHSDPRVTQQHYIRAQNFKAMAQWGDILRGIKSTE
jgi:hypothetical protein